MVRGDLNNRVNFQHVNTQSVWVWRLTLIVIYYEAYFFSSKSVTFYLNLMSPLKSQLKSRPGFNFNLNSNGAFDLNWRPLGFHLFKNTLKVYWQSCLFLSPATVQSSLLQSLSLPPTSPFPCVHNETSKWKTLRGDGQVCQALRTRLCICHQVSILSFTVLFKLHCQHGISPLFYFMLLA